jgi:small subunit ribosomal protein S15
MLEKKDKQRIINKFRVHDTDTGSSQVQIAILTEEVKELTKHLKTHKKDFSSRRGLLRKVAERRKLLHYLSREDNTAYLALIKDLKLKTVEPKVLKGDVIVPEDQELLQEEAEAEEAK